MNLLAMIEALEAQGLSDSQILAAIKHAERTTQEFKKDLSEQKRQDARIRQQRHREKPSNINHRVTYVTRDISPMVSTPSLTPLLQKEPPKGVSQKVAPEGFSEFRSVFPKQRPGSWDKAESAYRHALTKSPAAEILAGVQAYAVSDEVRRGFAKGAAGWLNDERWKCDYAVIAKGADPPGWNPKGSVDSQAILRNIMERKRKEHEQAIGIHSQPGGSG